MDLRQKIYFVYNGRKIKQKNKFNSTLIVDPKDPKYLPNNPAKHEPIIDKNINSIYIF